MLTDREYCRSHRDHSSSVWQAQAIGPVLIRPTVQLRGRVAPFRQVVLSAELLDPFRQPKPFDRRFP